MTTKMLLASDGSTHAFRATEEAIKLAKLNDSEVIIAYVQKDNEKTATDSEESIKQLKGTEELLKASSIRYRIQTLTGDPGEAISDFANSQAFEFLVIGSRGLNKMQEMVMGSVSYYVMKHAQCPVLVVK